MAKLNGPGRLLMAFRKKTWLSIPSSWGSRVTSWEKGKIKVIKKCVFSVTSATWSSKKTKMEKPSKWPMSSWCLPKSNSVTETSNRPKFTSSVVPESEINFSKRKASNMRWSSTEWATCTEFRVSLSIQWDFINGRWKSSWWNLERTALALPKCTAVWAMPLFAVDKSHNLKSTTKKVFKFIKKSRAAKALKFQSFTTTWATSTNSNSCYIKLLINIRNAFK